MKRYMPEKSDVRMIVLGDASSIGGYYRRAEADKRIEELEHQLREKDLLIKKYQDRVPTLSQVNALWARRRRRIMHKTRE